jgi:hypothetical protein
MTIYSLYIKTHLKTGLKYLGQTTKNPHEYKGSGIDWKQHLYENGNDVHTEILYEGTDRNEMTRLGRYYSELWDVSNSSEWANRIPETGGGVTPTPETREKLSKTQIGRKKPPRSIEHIKNLSDSCKGIKKPRSTEHQLAWSESAKRNWANNAERKKQVSELGKSNKGKKHSQETIDKKRTAMKEYWAKKKLQDS